MKLKNTFITLCLITIYSAKAQTRKIQFQKIAVYDYNLIEESVPQIKSAKLYYFQKLELWKSNLNDMYLKLSLMEKELSANNALFTKEMVKERKAAIEKQKLDILEIENTYFGKEGKEKKLYQTQIQQYKNFVTITARNIGITSDYDLIFDKASGKSVLYAKKKYDLSPLIINALKKELTKISH